MKRIRPSRVIPTAVGCVLACSMVTWATDPAWARSMGVDVWNVGALENQLQESEWERSRLERLHLNIVLQYEANLALVQAVHDGQIPLQEASAQMLKCNEFMPGYMEALKYRHKGETLEARAAHNLVIRINQDHRFSAEDKLRTCQRLGQEYLQTYGTPAPW